MDIITHGLVGMVIGATAKDFPVNRKIFWLVCALAPDLDMLSGLGGSIAYYSYHRRILHGLPGAMILILLLSFLYTRYSRGKITQGLFISGTAIFSHLFLDVATSFGTSLLYPFSSQDYMLDLVFAFDLWLAGGLIVCLVAGCIFSRGRRVAALAGMIFMACYLVGCLFCRHWAMKQLDSEIAAGRLASEKAAVLPQPYSPTHWAGYVTTPEGTWAGRFSIFAPTNPDLHLFPLPHRNVLLKIADQTESARRFLAFARFPHVEEVESHDRVTFIYTDLRFSFSGVERSNRFYGVKVEISNDGRILSQGLTHE
jgi:inner membrane protein